MSNYRQQLVNELEYLEQRKDKLWFRYFSKPTCVAQKQVLKAIDEINDQFNLIWNKLYRKK